MFEILKQVNDSYNAQGEHYFRKIITTDAFFLSSKG
jgi:hypothetical protein